MCQMCDDGFCPRHHVTALDWLHFDAYYVDDREREQEAEQERLSARDFEQPLGRIA